MRKIFIITLLTVFMLTIVATPVFAAKKAKHPAKTKNLAITYETSDGFAMSSTLYYPTEKKKQYPLIVLLHSLGYTSAYWESLPYICTKAGFAALTIDLRGHGKSNHNIDYKTKSWQYLSLKSYARYPNDVKEIIEYVFQTYKNIEPSYAFIGADIGANTAVLATKNLKQKPFAMILISPLRTFKGLYIPITLADIGPIPILAIASVNDKLCYKELFELKKYAQGTYETRTVETGGTGIMLVKRNPDIAYQMVNWLVDRKNQIKPAQQSKETQTNPTIEIINK